MNISIHILNTEINVLIFKSIEDIRIATSIHAEVQILQTHSIREWPQNKDNLEPSVGRYLPIRHDPAMIDGVAMNNIMNNMNNETNNHTFSVQKKILHQLHSNHMETEKTWLITRVRILDQHEC